MKKLCSLLFILFLLPHVTVNAKTPEEGLIDALENTSAEKLQQGRDVRWELSSEDSKAGLYGPMAQPFNSALNTIKNKGIIPREKPSDSTRLHQWTYLCSHNAFSSKAHGYGLYKQQNLSMTEQLNRGARALMLDTWLANDIIRLTHAEPKYDKLLRGLAGTKFLNLFQEGMHMKKELTKLKEEFFDKPENKGEVVFLILEDYIDNRDLMDKTLEATGLASKILKPSEWDPRTKNGWPTFKWMKDNNKQIVIFSNKGKTKYLYPQWPNMYENRYGEINDAGAAKQRGDSKKYMERERYFYLFNFFEDYAEKAFGDINNFGDAVVGVVKFLQEFDYKKINGPDLTKAINYSLNKGPEIIQGRYPNFIAIDFVEKAYKDGEGPYKLIDEINKKARTNPGKFYRVIQQK